MSKHTIDVFDAHSMERADLCMKLYEQVSLVLSDFLDEGMHNTVISLIADSISCSNCKIGGYCRIRDEFHLEFCSEWLAREGGDNEL